MGDRQAADRLLAAQQPWLARFFARHVRRREDAEDLAQDVLTRASASLERFRGDCPFSQWVLAIARSTLYNYYERDPYRKGRYVPWPEENADEVLDPQRGADAQGLSSVVEQRTAAARLLEVMAGVCTPDERRVITMVWQGESLEEAGALLGKTASTARSLFRRGRQKVIAHAVRHDPDLLGGREAIDQAWAQAEAARDPDERPTPREAEAWREPDGRLEQFRNACLKLARFLPAALLGFWLR